MSSLSKNSNMENILLNAICEEGKKIGCNTTLRHDKNGKITDCIVDFSKYHGLQTTPPNESVASAAASASTSKYVVTMNPDENIDSVLKKIESHFKLPQRPEEGESSNPAIKHSASRSCRCTSCIPVAEQEAMFETLSGDICDPRNMHVLSYTMTTLQNMITAISSKWSGSTSCKECSYYRQQYQNNVILCLRCIDRRIAVSFYETFYWAVQYIAEGLDEFHRGNMLQMLECFADAFHCFNPLLIFIHENFADPFPRYEDVRNNMLNDERQIFSMQRQVKRWIEEFEDDIVDSERQQFDDVKENPSRRLQEMKPYRYMATNPQNLGMEANKMIIRILESGMIPSYDDLRIMIRPKDSSPLAEIVAEMTAEYVDDELEKFIINMEEKNRGGSSSSQPPPPPPTRQPPPLPPFSASTLQSAKSKKKNTKK